MVFPNPFVKNPVYFRKILLITLIFLFPYTIIFMVVDKSFAQIPKPAQPELLEKKFEKPVAPKSTLDPVVPKYKDPAPSKMEEIRLELTGIVFKGSTVYTDSDFLPYYGDYLGTEISLAKVYEFAAAITAKYRNDGYLLSRAIVPPQTISSGIVHIKVIEGFIDDIDIKGQVKGRMKRLWAFGDKIINSRPLQAKVLERYLLLINDLPGIKTESVLTPSETTPGAATLTLIIRHKAVDGFASLDNRGSQFNGPLQGSLGGNLNSLLGLDERTGFHFVTTAPMEELIYFSGNHEQQIGSNGTKAILSGSLSYTEPGSTLEPLKVEGESSTISILIFHPFIRSREQNLSGRAGFFLRNTETEISGSVSARDRLRVFNLGFSYDFVDRFRGVSLVNVEFRQGADIFDATESGSALLSRTQGKSDFSKISANMWRHQNIVAGWSVLVEASGQYSFDSLLASEEFSFGGARFGRGYDSSEITGDQGLAVKGELQYFHKIGQKYLRDIKAYAFYDYGSVWQKGNDFTGTERQSSLSSAGGGIRFNLTDWLSGYVEAAKPLDDRVISEGNKDIRGFASLIARF